MNRLLTPPLTPNHRNCIKVWKSCTILILLVSDLKLKNLKTALSQFLETSIYSLNFGTFRMGHEGRKLCSSIQTKIRYNRLSPRFADFDASTDSAVREPSLTGSTAPHLSESSIHSRKFTEGVLQLLPIGIGSNRSNEQANAKGELLTPFPNDNC